LAGGRTTQRPDSVDWIANQGGCPVAGQAPRPEKPEVSLFRRSELAALLAPGSPERVESHAAQKPPSRAAGQRCVPVRRQRDTRNQIVRPFFFRGALLEADEDGPAGSTFARAE